MATAWEKKVPFCKQKVGFQLNELICPMYGNRMILIIGFDVTIRIQAMPSWSSLASLMGLSAAFSLAKFTLELHRSTWLWFLVMSMLSCCRLGKFWYFNSYFIFLDKNSLYLWELVILYHCINVILCWVSYFQLLISTLHSEHTLSNFPLTGFSSLLKNLLVALPTLTT